ncbi:MAG: methylated-DNA--[protein]-cysteine S-methyltransferase [Gemmatimonadaceae bacterium]|nr:methylated-DNA--[protein]-cysteine S-methyltransferase [Gemmatimonadaceae bacterium]
MTQVAYEWIESPVGPLLLAARGEALTAVYFARSSPASTWVPAVHAEAMTAATLAEVRRQLGEYFAGTRQRFALVLDAEGTEFQRRVWNGLDTIPYGSVLSYGELARRIGSPAAIRAVGAANGRNPLSIVRPCHRVIGADGSLTGFGGGLPAKQWLLTHEGAQLL